MSTKTKPMRPILQSRRLYCSTNSSKAKGKFTLFAGRRGVQIGALTAVAAGSGLLYIEWLTLDRAVHYKPDPVLPERGSEYIYINATENKDDLVTQVKSKVHWRIKALEYILKDKDSESVWPFRVPRLFSGEKSHVWKDPKSLLKKAQSANRQERLLGVAALCKKHTSWHDSDYRAIAQACDSRTLIGLARSPDSDLRFFLAPPSLCQEQDQKVVIEAAFTKLLASLPRSNVDRCTQYFTMAAMQQSKKALAEDQTGSIVFGGNALSFVATLSKIPEEALDQVYLLALISHSEVSSHCEEIVKLGGLQLLMRVYQARENSPKILSHVAQIIANLAAHPFLHDKLMQAGWVSVLAKWMKSKHLPLSAQASRALANLDRDWSSETFGNGVYVLHPHGRSSEPVLADVVFVHGLSGGAFYTWRQGKPVDEEALPGQPHHPPAQPPAPTEDGDGQKNTGEEKKKEKFVWCWPKSWLARDCPHMRIVTVSYDTQITDWASKCPFEGEKHSLAQRSGEMLRKLHEAGVGQRPIIWVTHSMGGLLVKQMLIDASQSETMASVMGETKGVVFYSTPHHGSSLAAYSQQAKYLLYPSTEVKELSLDSPILRNLHGRFRALVQTHQLPVLTFGESIPTNIGLSVKTLVVPPLSSNPGCGDFHEMPMDHQNICKPHSRNSLLYQLTLRFIQRNISLPLSVALSEKLEELLQDPEEEEIFYPLGMSFGE